MDVNNPKMPEYKLLKYLFNLSGELKNHVDNSNSNSDSEIIDEVGMTKSEVKRAIEVCDEMIEALHKLMLKSIQKGLSDNEDKA